MSTFFSKFTQKAPENDTPLEAHKQPSLKGSFESMNSMDLGFSTSKTCYICAKKFNFRKKHFCKFCQNAVCSDHSSKVRAKEGQSELQRICDFCDQEELKTLIKSQIDDEISKLGEELKQAKDTNERLYKDHFEKTAAVNQIEEEISTFTLEHQSKMVKIAEDTDSQQHLKQNGLAMLENLKKILEISKNNQKNINNSILSKTEHTDELIKNAIGTKELLKKNREMAEKVRGVIAGSLDSNLFINDLCARCKGHVKEIQNKTMESPPWELTSEEEKLEN